MCVYLQDMKFLWLYLWLGGLSTNDNNANDNDNDAALQHATDDSWLQKLFDIYAKLVKTTM